MRRASIVSIALFVAGLICFGQQPRAQLTMSGFGQGGFGVAAAGYSGPGDVLSGASAFWGLRGYNAAFTGNVANICDVATGLVCADVTWNGTALVFPLIGGVACDNGAALCQVKTLYDQSGALACAASTNCDVTQATAANRPTLVVAGAANGCPTTAFPCMAFVRASSQCLVSTNTYTRVQPVSAAWVVNKTGSVGSPQTAISLQAGATLNGGWPTASPNTINITAGTARTKGGVNDNTWHAVQGVFSSSVGSLSADGSTTTNNNGANAPSGGNLVMGASVSACSTNGMDGKYVEAGIWPVDFTSSVGALNSNAHSYWGF